MESLKKAVKHLDELVEIKTENGTTSFHLTKPLENLFSTQQKEGGDQLINDLGDDVRQLWS